jgi:hypothetical protein
MFINRAIASIGERDGLGISECVDKDCTVATFSDIVLAIIGLFALLFILWAYETLVEKWENKRLKNKSTKQDQPNGSKKLVALIKTKGKSKEQIKEEVKQALEKNTK